MCGGAIPQAVAAKWAATPPTCPHCGLAPEDSFHRFWVCPQWTRVRLAALGGKCVQDLQQVLPFLALTHGLLPMCPQLEANQRYAELAGSLPPPTPVCGPVWTDGSGIHPRDPTLRRSAWAAVWWISTTSRRRLPVSNR